MKIKICGITDAVNLHEIIDLKPDFMGFIFYPASPRYMIEKLSPDDLMDIPKSIKRTGVFVNADLYTIEGLYWRYNLDFVQLHGDESPIECKQLSSSGLNIIKAFRLDHDFNFDILMDYIPYCKYFLFDTNTVEYGGSGKKFDWEILEKYDAGYPFILSGGIGSFDAEEILSIKHPSFYGIDLNSRFETSPGIKDVEKLRPFLKSVR